MTDQKKHRERAKKSAKGKANRSTKSTGRARKGKRTEPGSAEAGTTFVGPDRIHDFASTLAGRGDAETDTTPQRLETWVTFTLAGETYCLPVTAVQEILRVSRITSVPHAPHTVRGIINMRGRVVPVVDFRMRLSLPVADIDTRSRILITSTRGHLVGLLVDSVEQVVSLDMATIAPPPSDVMTMHSGYIVGVCNHAGRLLILLDAEEVLLVSDSLVERNMQEAAREARS